MHFFKVALAVVALVCHTHAKGYGPTTGGFGSISTGGLGGFYGIGGAGGRGGAPGISGRPGFSGGVAGSYAPGVGGRPGLSGGVAGGYAPGVGGRPGLSGGVAGGYAPTAGGRPGLSGGVAGGYAPSAGGRLGLSGGVAGGYVPGYVGGIGGSNVDMSPKPYSTGFAAPDGEGGASFRSEQADGSGAVQGTYGYTDAQGLYRMVEYVADQYGFRAIVNTNEPGVDGKENPADVTMFVEQTPFGIQEQYTVQPGSGVGGVGGMLFGGIGPAGLVGGQPGRNPGSSILTGQYPAGLGGQPGHPGSLARGYPGGLGGQGGTAGLGALAGGIGSRLPGTTIGAIGGSSGIFSGIPRSTSRKSAY